jgi:hypothetical protein
MVAFATAPQAKAALRIDDGDLVSDQAISDLIDVASEMVAEFIKVRQVERTIDASTSPPTTEVLYDLDASPIVYPERVRHATIMLVGYLYRAPDSNPSGEWTQGNMPWTVSALLYQLRDPALA